MLLARAVTGRREIVRNAWNIYRNPKLIKTSHHSSRGSLSPASKTRDWISFKIFTYDAPADQWSCTQRDNELAADLMLRVQTQESQALWSPITNGEIIFMIPAARGICIQIYIHIFTSFVYMNAFLLEGNHHTPGTLQPLLAPSIKRGIRNEESNEENRRTKLICCPNSYLNTNNSIVHGTIIIAECCMTAWPQCIGCQPSLDSSMLGSPAPISQNYGTINQQNDNYDTQHFYF